MYVRCIVYSQFCFFHITVPPDISDADPSFSRDEFANDSSNASNIPYIS